MAKIVHHEPRNYVTEVEWSVVDHNVSPGLVILKRHALTYQLSEKTGKMLKSTAFTSNDQMIIERRDLPAIRQALGA